MKKRLKSLGRLFLVIILCCAGYSIYWLADNSEEATLEKGVDNRKFYRFFITDSAQEECVIAKFSWGAEVTRYPYKETPAEKKKAALEGETLAIKRNKDETITVRVDYDRVTILARHIREIFDHINSLRGGQKDDDGHQ